MIHLRSITSEDIAEIKNWPTYSHGFEQMDYALRNSGWLDEFWKKPNSWIYIAELNKANIGFSLLTITDDKEAEFRIALHPQWTGKGLGEEITLATLKTGSLQKKMDRIHLIVRKNNHPALKLYEKLGFSKIGESTHPIQAKLIEFINMDMSCDDFNSLYSVKKE